MTSVHCPQNKKQQQYFFFIFVDLKTKRIPRLKTFLHVFFNIRGLYISLVDLECSFYTGPL